MKRIGFAVIVVAAIAACQSDRPFPPGPNALIQDAGHNGGNFFFAFLQPMVSHPVTNGVFDPNLLPTVNLLPAPGSLCADPGVTYTTTTGPGSDGSEKIRVNATDHNYIVNLHTDKVPVISGCTYRIQVLVGSTELGVADIELFLTQKAAKNITSDETLALVDGRTLPIKFWIAGGALCADGADCGQGTAYPDRDNVIVTQNLGAGVFIPAGAVDAGTTIIIESIDRRPCFDGLFGKTFQGAPGPVANSCYQFRADPPLPDGKFNSPVVVGLCVDLSNVTAAQKPKIQIFQFDAGVPDRSPDRIKPLPDAAAPFLPCDPAYPGAIGLEKHGILDFAAHLFTSLVSPKPAFASSRAVVFDVGAGGSTDGFSLFTWGLVTNLAKQAGDLQTAVVGTAVATPPSVIFTDSTGAPVDSVPVTFSLGSGGGSVTGAVTKSGRGGVAGVAQVGSWTLGSVGANTLVASAPAFSGVTPTSVTFTATGTVAGAWTAAGSLPGGTRRDHTATLLNNGDVLIVGGTSAGAVIYNSSVGSLTATEGAPLFNHNQGASATKLLDGRVLIVGGNGSPFNAEIYDPGTGSFSATAGGVTEGLTNASRQYHTATLLSDGRVLLAGGQFEQSCEPPALCGPQTHNEAEIYDPETDSFTPTGSLSVDRAGHAATLLQDGKVLIAGGNRTTSPGFSTSLASAELYDPATGTFSSTGSMTEGRGSLIFTGITLLGNGKVLVVGGLSGSITAELYDPGAGTFSTTGSMAGSHIAGRATLLADGRVLVAGGFVTGGCPITLGGAEIYNPALGAFTPAAPMTTSRLQFTATRLNDGRVLAVGGFSNVSETACGDIGSAELFSLSAPIP